MTSTSPRAHAQDESDDGESLSPDLEATFDRTVEEGGHRINRTWPGLLATGAVGGADVSLGVLTFALVLHETHSRVLGALAFSVGFIALTLANSELFTENFLVPIASVVAGRSNWLGVVRLWTATLATNLIGGWLMTGLIILAVPELKPDVVELGHHFVTIGHGREAWAAAVLAGAVLTLMTWMQHSTESVGARIVAAVLAAFILAGASLNHAIVASLEMFAALQSGAPFGYLDWLGMVALAVVGNMIGGVGLVTMLRMIQIGRGKIEHEREVVRPAGS